MKEKSIYFPPDTGGHYNIKFSDRCIYCGQSRETYVNVTPKWSERTLNAWVEHSFTFRVPYCDKHAKESLTNITILKYIFYFGLLLTVVGGFIKIRPDEVTAIGGTLFILVLVGGVIGLLIAWLAKKFLSRFIQSMDDTPIPIPKVVEGVTLGFSADFMTFDPHELVLTFKNEEIAHEWMDINEGATDIDPYKRSHEDTR
jgi:hypothetical protein